MTPQPCRTPRPEPWPWANPRPSSAGRRCARRSRWAWWRPPQTTPNWCCSPPTWANTPMLPTFARATASAFSTSAWPSRRWSAPRGGCRRGCGECFLKVGMAEQALVGAAAGLSKVGKVAYCTTYGTFATRRAYDFLAIACAHSHENVKMFAGNPGLTTGYGGTHQATEDLALMRSIPNMSVIDPCDATEMAQIAEMAADLPGTLYCRLLRADVAQVFDPATHRWRPGTGHVIGSSAADTDVGLVSTGLMTGRAIDAAGHLRQRGASASVFHSASLKPFDSQGLLAFAQSARRLVVLENHVASGGLATLVIEALQEAGLARRLLKIALPDQFIECGSLAYLQERYGLTTERICARVGAWLQ